MIDLTEKLWSPSFWQEILAIIPPMNEKRLDTVLAAVAAAAGVPVEFVRDRMGDYLDGEMADHRGEVRVGTETIH